MRRGRRTIQAGTFADEVARPRVLVEHSDGMMAWALQHFLEGEGYDVATCRGPGGHGACPLVVSGHCAAAEDADVILHDVRPADGVGGDVLSALRRNLPDTPVVIGTRSVMTRDRARRAVSDAVGSAATKEGVS